MPISSHLLERAYRLIDAKQMQNAELVLDAVVRVDPQNVEAWVAYMEIHRDYQNLEWLKERILRTREINPQDKSELLLYHAVLIEHLRKLETETPKFVNYNPSFKPAESAKAPAERSVFELLSIFNYSTPKAEPAPRRRPARRRFWKDIDLASPKQQGIALLLVFILALRLLVTAHPLLGYGLLGIFLFGSIHCLQNYAEQHPFQPNGLTRAYLLEDQTKLTEKKIVEVKQSEEPQTPKS